MRVELRIIAGTLRRRKLTCDVGPELRPTPAMVREALFSILGEKIASREFFDIFAGTGINGLEALSRGARLAHFVERDFRLVGAIKKYLASFDLSDRATIHRNDAYRWVKKWTPPNEPVNVFVSPPFADLHNQEEAFLELVDELLERTPDGSSIVLQTERHSIIDKLPRRDQWEERTYGRNVLLILDQQGDS